MSWCRALPLLLFTGASWASEGYILGLGVEADSSDGLAASVVGSVGVAQDTWLSASLARNSTELPRGQRQESWYADIDVDHWFDPVGVRAGVAYWGNRDVLQSVDWLGSVYVRGDRATLGGDVEYRDFRFVLPQTDFFAGRTVTFDATGIGLTARFELTDTTSIALSAIDYDYSLDLNLESNRRLLDLLSFSRFSLINSLVDYRVSANIGFDVGEHRWQFDARTWKGEVDGAKTVSGTIRFLTPIGDGSDIELGLGVDDSDLYGRVTFLSAFLYFYGD